jgi:hypothetical protein
MKIRITGTAAELRAEVERISDLYHVVSETAPQACRRERGQLRVYLEVDPDGRASGVLLNSSDAAHALATMYALAAMPGLDADTPRGLDRLSAEVTDRIASAIAAAAGRPSTVHPAPDNLSASPR